MILRDLIGDVADVPTYSDDRLEQAIVSSAFLLLRQISFDEDYVVEVQCRTITPDPSSDYDFLALVVLRTAVLILSSELKTSSLSSIKVVDGPSSVDMTSLSKTAKDLLAQASKQFEEAKLAHQIGNGGYGEAILSPYGSFWSNHGGYRPR